MNRFYRYSVTLQRATDSIDPVTRTASRSWVTVGTYRGDIQARAGVLRQNEAGKSHPAEHVGYFGRDVPLQKGDRIIEGGSTYEVAFVANRRGHHLEADLALLDP